MDNKVRVLRRMQHMLGKGMLDEVDNSVKETRSLRHAHKKAHSLYQGQTRVFTDSTGQSDKVSYPRKIQYNGFYPKLNDQGLPITSLNGHAWLEANDPDYAPKRESRNSQPAKQVVQLPQVTDMRIKLAQQKLAESEVAPKDHL